ncbi:alpha-1,4-glucan--maltose-1-phosphate maltosyltransferase [Acuticoccus sp. MNP-M23]|uniref:alpha-1,4-glucan--maltose-1-phosphate maltosyltransferase n=1 Tax=Acuticoccus sp. MNP-M23 TaxID=3072793 RepID=UPI0028150A7F|nr:alpha-1,4-glucan--maltose-1-phosphate maltosyltransferase [Acuticoccus sp. MNP-M23]WMS40796.1 alpha-1,4-glucan--maltose-1-phosphate maltosyltransferase [Acuticoccus sp. MNP-M23]
MNNRTTTAPVAAPPAAAPSTPGSEASLIANMALERVAIEGIDPEIDGGRFPAKTVVGRPFIIEADVFGEGHDEVDAAILWRKAGDEAWQEAPLTVFDNQRWRGHFTPTENARHEYTVIAWRDLWGMWRYEVSKKHAAGVPIALELQEGADLLAASVGAGRGSAEDQAALKALAANMADADDSARFAEMMTEDTAGLMQRAGHRGNLTRYNKILDLTVDRTAAVFSAWYEIFPRSMSNDVNRHGTFDDVIDRLPYVSGLGFDVLYFPPIHPIGRKNRKGKNNSLTAGPDDVGSPYAIGAEEGGHDAIHPELGGFDAFKRLVDAARQQGLEIALDYALNCSPDHPWIKEHHDWFDWRPDGSIRYAENPPKKYEDIVNVRFYAGDEPLPELWIKQRDIFLFWIEHGVKIFRVDNPHTKAFPFWEWVIADVQKKHPDAIFLAEAFTRPKVMHRLAKVGFAQSYSYFTWRNTKAELTEYMTELTTTEKRHTMRVNFFVNTPDINPVYLQTSGRPGFQARLVLAASLAGNYGVYSGFELCEGTPIPGKEEYLNSEKYEIKAWDWDRPGNIRQDVALMNQLRRTHPALQEFTNLQFYTIWNDNILYYGKRTADRSSFLLFAVNLDPHNGQGGNFEVPLWELGLGDDASVEVEDLVAGYNFTWTGKIQHVFIDPQQRPYFIWRLINPTGRI